MDRARDSLVRAVPADRAAWVKRVSPLLAVLVVQALEHPDRAEVLVAAAAQVEADSLAAVDDLEVDAAAPAGGDSAAGMPIPSAMPVEIDAVNTPATSH